MTTSPIKLPRTPALMADRLYKLKALKSEAQAKVDAIDAERKAIEAELINLLPKDEASGVQGKLARVALIVKDVPQLEDLKKVQAWAKRHGAEDIFQTPKLSTEAVRERWEDGVTIPGVGVFHKVSVSLNKV